MPELDPLSELTDPNRAALNNPRVRTFLDKISQSEGADYDTLVGGKRIKDLSRHPNIVGLTTSAGPSTAFGRYQITHSTHKSKLAKYADLDYSPENQDVRAVELLRQTGALKALENDDEATAIKRAGKEWASLPGSSLPGRKNYAAFKSQAQDPLTELTQKIAPQVDPLTEVTGMARSQQTRIRPMRRRVQPAGQVAGSGIGPKPVVIPKDFVAQEILSPHPNLVRRKIKQQVESEQQTGAKGVVGLWAKAQTDPSAALHQIGDYLTGDPIENETDRRYAEYQRQNQPDVVQGRKELGAMPAWERTYGAPALRASAGLLKSIANASPALIGLEHLTGRSLTDYLEKKGQYLEDVSAQPLTQEGEPVKRGLLEKAGTAGVDLTFGLVQLAGVQKATGLPLSNIMAMEAALKTRDPAEIAQAYAQGRVLDKHLSRLASATVFGAPVAGQSAINVAHGKESITDAALNTAIQAGTGYVFGGKPAEPKAESLTVVPNIEEALKRRGEISPPLQPKDLARRTALREGNYANQTEAQPNVETQPESAQPAPIVARTSVSRAADRRGEPSTNVGIPESTAGVSGTDRGVMAANQEANRGRQAAGGASVSGAPEGSKAVGLSAADIPRHVDLQARRQRGEGKGQFKSETRAEREARRQQVNPPAQPESAALTESTPSASESATNLQSQEGAASVTPSPAREPWQMTREEFDAEHLLHGTNIEKGKDFDYVEPQIGDMTRTLYAGAGEGTFEELGGKPLAYFKPTAEVDAVKQYATGVAIYPKKGEPYLLLTERPSDALRVGEDEELYDFDGNLISREAPLGAENGDIISEGGASVLYKIPLKEFEASGAKDLHEFYVRKAFKEGKPVPPEVLADYPDLAPASGVSVPEGKPRVIIADDRDLSTYPITPRERIAAELQTLPPPNGGFTRLYRGEGAEGSQRLTPTRFAGRWFSSDPGQAGITAQPTAQAKLGNVSYVDVPTADLDQYHALTKAGLTRDELNEGVTKAEYILPSDLVSTAKDAKLKGVEPVVVRASAALSPQPETKPPALSKVETKPPVSSETPQDLRQGEPNATSIRENPRQLRSARERPKGSQEAGGNDVYQEGEGRIAPQQGEVSSGRPPPSSTGNRESTSIKNRATDELRSDLDLLALEQPEKKSFQQSIDNAVAKGLDKKAESIAQDVIDGKKMLGDEEEAGIQQRIRELENQHEELYAENPRSPRLKQIEDRLELLTRASRVGGTPLARALSFRRSGIDRDYRLVTLLRRARDFHGRELTDVERGRYEKMASEIKSLQKDLSEANEKLKNQTLDKTIQKIRKQSQRAETKKVLDDEFASLKAQLAQAKLETRSGVQPSLLARLDPEGKLTPIIARMAKNRVKAGINSAEALVEEIYQAVKEKYDVSKEDISRLVRGTLHEPDDVLSKWDKRRQSQLLKQEAELDRKLKTGDFGVKERETPIYNRETFKIQKRINELKLKFENEKYRATRGTTGRTLDTVAGFGNLPKTMLSMADLSAVLRQGGIGVYQHPILSGKAAVDMLKSFTQHGFANVENAIKSHPDFETLKRAGVEFTGVDKDNPNLSKREEGYLGADVIDTLAQGKLNPVRLVKGVKDFSERTFVSFLDSQRMRIGAHQLEALRGMGLKGEALQKAIKSQAKYINIITGRGNLGQMGNQAAPFLNIFGFSPRLVASRFQFLNKMLNPVAWANMPRGARKLQMVDNAKFLFGVASTLALLKAAGATVGSDPEDADFLKVRIGNSHYDDLAGLQQPMRFMIRMAEAAKGGETYAGDDKGKIFADFARSKAAPGVGYLWDYLEGKNRLSGKKFEAGKDLVRTMIPLPLQDFRDAVKQDGAVKGIAETMPTILGVGVQNYPASPEKPSTHAEYLARKKMRASMPPDEGRTQDELDQSQKLSDLRHRSRQGEDVSKELEGLGLKDSQKKAILEAKGRTRLQEDFKHLGIKDALLVYGVATPKEKGELKDLIAEKADLVNNLPESEQNEVRAKMAAIGIVPIGPRVKKVQKVEKIKPRMPAQNYGFAQ